MTAPHSSQPSSQKLGRNPFASKAQPQPSSSSKTKLKTDESSSDAPVRLIHIMQGVLYWVMGATLERLANQLSRRS